MKEQPGNQSAPKKHVLIFGGTKGLGLATARLFAGAGELVSVIGRNPPAEKPDHNKAADIQYFKFDLGQPDQINDTLEKIFAARGLPDNLVFCQRYRGKEDAWQGEWGVSLTATKKAVDFWAGKLTEKRGGAIVITSSLAGEFIVPEQALSYHLAKAALNQLIRYYAVTLGAKGVRVNGVSPGILLKEESRDYFSQNKPLYELYRQITPLGRLITAEEIAAVIFFLCSLNASAITGQNLVVDGGLCLRGQAALAKELKG